jgi:hypothetical protein
LDTIDSTSSRGLPRSYDVLYLFTSNGFILLLGGNHEEDQHKLTTLYDVSLTNGIPLTWVQITISQLRS